MLGRRWNRGLKTYSGRPCIRSSSSRQVSGSSAYAPGRPPGRRTPAIATAALLFLPLWLAGAGINMVLGVKRAGYSVKEEAPMFLLVFAVPATAALLAWWMLR
jgi:hypothetical protein